jgi:hypothetical protein
VPVASQAVDAQAVSVEAQAAVQQKAPEQTPELQRSLAACPVPATQGVPAATLGVQTPAAQYWPAAQPAASVQGAGGFGLDEQAANRTNSPSPTIHEKPWFLRMAIAPIEGLRPQRMCLVADDR